MSLTKSFYPIKIRQKISTPPPQIANFKPPKTFAPPRHNGTSIKGTPLGQEKYLLNKGVPLIEVNRYVYKDFKDLLRREV